MDSSFFLSLRDYFSQGASRGHNFLDEPGTNQDLAVGSVPSSSRPLYQDITDDPTILYPLPLGTSIGGIDDRSQSALPSSTTAAENIAVASVQSSSEPTYQDIRHLSGAYHGSTTKDASIEDVGVQFQSVLPISVATTGNASLPRDKHETFDWKAQKKTIERLYMHDDKTLTATMDIMKTAHSFFATKKQYKNKFKEWGWQKNLPSETALFMTRKAKRRRQTENKETVFFFGGKVWRSDSIEIRADRTRKKPRLEDDLEKASTPNGVTYSTPITIVDTLHLEHSEMNSSSDNVIEVTDDSDDTHFKSITGNYENVFTWKGHSRGDIKALRHIAHNHRNAGEIKEAEDALRKVLRGTGHFSGNTNDETVKAAYDLADLYATTGRIGEARKVLEELIQVHVHAWGREDTRTRENALQAVDLLNKWRRSDDALALLSQSSEALDTCTSRPEPETRRRAIDKGKGVHRTTTQKPASYLSEVAEPNFLGDITPTSIEKELGVVQARVAAEDHAAGDQLIAIISQCENRPDLSMQEIKAYAELLTLYHKLDEVEAYESTFKWACRALNSAWEVYDRYKDEVQSLRFMESALQLVANILKYGYKPEARRMFLEASQKATDVFGSSDERTVWVHITIAHVYQTHTMYKDAEEWFERAVEVVCSDSAGANSKSWRHTQLVTKGLMY